MIWVIFNSGVDHNFKVETISNSVPVIQENIRKEKKKKVVDKSVKWMNEYNAMEWKL